MKVSVERARSEPRATVCCYIDNYVLEPGHEVTSLEKKVRETYERHVLEKVSEEIATFAVSARKAPTELCGLLLEAFHKDSVVRTADDLEDSLIESAVDWVTQNIDLPEEEG